jgi:hypothetical protein
MININRSVCSVEGLRHRGAGRHGWQRGRIPRKGGAIPTMRSPAGGLLAVMPTIYRNDDCYCPSCQAQLHACAAAAGPDRLTCRRQPLDEVATTPRAAERRA